MCLTLHVGTETFSETFHLQRKSALESVTLTPSREAEWRLYFPEIQASLYRIRLCPFLSILRYLTEALGDFDGGLIEQCWYIKSV